MSFSVELATCTDEKNKIFKDFNAAFSVKGTLKNETSIISPTIILNCSVDAVANFNYARISEFGNRYYFITNIQSVRTGLTSVSMSVDPLMTYRDEISTCSAVISRSSRSGDANFTLPDTRYPVTQKQLEHTLTYEPLYTNGTDPTKGQTMILVLTGTSEGS